MNKQETLIVVLIFVFLMVWMFISRQKNVTPPAVGGKEALGTNVTMVAGDGSATSLTSPDSETAAPEGGTESAKIEDDGGVPDVSKGHLLPEEKVILSNDEMNVTVSSRGGAIVSVELRKYRATVDPESDLLCMDFSSKPALSLGGIPELSTNSDFTVSLNRDGKSVYLSGTTAQGLCLKRTITLRTNYALEVADVFSNNGTGQVTLPTNDIALGPMQMIQTKARVRGISYLGIDTLKSGGGEDVVHWAKKGARDDTMKIANRFQPEYRQGSGCSMMKPKLLEPLPAAINVARMSDTDWIAVKNKFFAQILAPKDSGGGYVLNVKRVVSETEKPDNGRSWASSAILKEVSADIRFRGRVLQAGESFTREMNYYVGPKKYSILKELGNHQDKVMFRAWRGWGWFRSLCIGLLWTLNAIFSVIPNYGVAIILLTVIVKVIFWPITHKSTENMKKMQKIQPLVTELREKLKDKPKKMNQEVMALYKTHKVNPMMGCLPMFIQIPVFIALFTVLRSAVELRFAEFLWIRDLSEPEGLFEGMLPIVGSLNILPLFMTATMIWQQRLTPTAGDPQQKKMMMMMPIIFLFIFYPMPSALVLYWSISQCLSIVQLLRQRRKGDKEESPGR